MSNQYKHLSKEERDRLAILKGQGFSIRAIASQLGRSPSTLSRELRRNADSNGSEDYLPHQAQTLADVRWKQSHCRPRLNSSFLQQYVRTHIRRGWSPEQTAGRLYPFRQYLRIYGAVSGGLLIQTLSFEGEMDADDDFGFGAALKAGLDYTLFKNPSVFVRLGSRYQVLAEGVGVPRTFTVFLGVGIRL
jgi:transcriptional regulator with XRE-family HTH domain